jgi:hypothetical protein
MHGCGTFVARRGSAVGHRQCSCETSSRAARPRAADAVPPRYPHVWGRSVALRTARSARATVGAARGNRWLPAGMELGLAPPCAPTPSFIGAH